jgi:hypothetical protein
MIQAIIQMALELLMVFYKAERFSLPYNGFIRLHQLFFGVYRIFWLSKFAFMY